MLAKLGKVSNKIIAELTGLTEQSISNKRKALGISRPRKSPKWKDEYTEHLGKDTDQKNAELWGVSILTVGHWRNALKIRPFKIKR